MTLAVIIIVAILCGILVLKLAVGMLKFGLLAVIVFFVIAFLAGRNG